MPRDRVTQNHQGFGFIEFRGPKDAEYAANVMNGVKVYGKPLRVNKASADKQKQANEVGAELYVGNIDPSVDEKILYDTFSRFGPLLSLPKVARDDIGQSKGFGFVSYADFESSDAAVEHMNGQYILSKEVAVQYAFKKDGKGERHGDEAERELAMQAKKRNIVPELQPVPQAFLSNGPPSQSPAAPTGPAAMTGGAPPAMATGGYDTGPPPGITGQIPPSAIPAGFGGPPARGPPQYAAGPPMMPPQGVPLGRGGAPVLPPAPTGLPARPPQAQGGYTNPAGFHPGSFRGPSPAGGPSPPPAFGTAPPGFAPPGQPGPGGPPGPPPGFMPPPGFQPPPGFPRR